jgi:4-amino-4-deoxy-L-arabinose transferase-like glycosyltransferase
LSAGLVVAFVPLYLGGRAEVPFHPDESTHLFMSRDFESLFLRRDLAALAWHPGEPLTPEARYRLLDAPLPRYLIGLARRLGGFSADELNGDWEWDQNWAANVRAGHLPAPALLSTARIPAALLGGLTPALMFWIGAKVRGARTGLFAALLLGLSPLMLLHTRRAMAEAPMLFFTCLSVWAGLRYAQAWDRLAQMDRPIFLGGTALGVIVGLAAASKHSAVVILPAVLLAAGLAIAQRPWPLARRMAALTGAWLAIGLSSGLTFLALNPVTYRAPVAVVAAMIRARADFVRAQVNYTAAVLPELTLTTIPERFRATLLELYLRPPAVWDAPVYLEELGPKAEAYWNRPLGRPSPMVGALVAGFGAAGMGASLFHLFRNRFNAATRAEQAVWLWSAAALSSILLFAPLDWQRYFLPLLPPACLFAALGADALAAPLADRLARKESLP